ncbi:MAG: VanW family protein [Clostridiales bacterium]|nr:VanW family protein [Clostridiales bacterium]
MYVVNFIASIFAAVPLICFPSAARSEPHVTVAAPIETEEAQGEVAVTINAGGKTFTYTDEYITPSDFTVHEEIERRRINSPLDRKIELVDFIIQKGASYKTALLYCFPRLERTMDAVAEYLYIAPIDAKVMYDGGRYYVTPEKAGRALDEERTYGVLYYSLKFFGGSKTVDAAVEVLEPDVFAAELKRALTLRSAYTTDYSSSTPQRAHNVETAVKKFDGVSIAPGEALSFNECVGERTEENGFQTAKIIVDGKYVDGVGGGACQASTAVYNAALLAGLDAAANAHSICPSYCPAGLDAMISSMSDLVITNTTDKPVYFSVSAGGGKATVKIFGSKREYDIVPESEINATVPHEEREFVDYERKYFDEGAERGDRLLIAPGKDGCLSTTYLKYYDGGKFVKRVKIRANIYKQSPQITAVAP